ncbi:uncharacterized protein LOC109897194 [Oncorhynchus kisutch]|uniref:uncharacterized protein LOC109897194 n=1 Tax=Oncorhynchus kisutch TaxID=8019 RepID=UPI0012DEF674|nr:uncharacterized protein LOC109897194 [Oncorhynchus kisutch]XP_031688652.1 uncharacterized protein LOC109897194 [Oncorhynchus kisutch]
MNMCKESWSWIPVQHVYIYIDEAGFNLAKRSGQGRNIIGHRAIVNVPGQRGGNITAISQQGVLYHHANLGPYNTALLITFLDTLHGIHIPTEQRGGPEQPRYVVICDNVSFHPAALVTNWFIEQPHGDGKCMTAIPSHACLFSRQWRMHVVKFVGAFGGWIHHSRRFFPRCLARENIACDVDEVLWSDQNRRQVFSHTFFLVFVFRVLKE